MAIASSDPIASQDLAAAGAERTLAELTQVRERTLALIAHLDDEQLSAVLSPIMSPLAWDLAHIAAYEDLWLCHRHGGLALLRPELAERYDAFETPRAVRGEIELLEPSEACEYLAAVRARATRALTARGVGDGTICELVLRHELQHTETMRQTMALVGLLPAGEPALAAMRGAGAGIEVPTHPSADRQTWAHVPTGESEIGAGPEGFAYDNERPRHPVRVEAYRIARLPVTGAELLRFHADGGYERREWWTEQGWEWRCAERAAPDPRVVHGDPEAPACHLSWYEADAFARGAGARLPSEAEWERAASLGVLGEVGQVWEWTASDFSGYHGFVAHPYREYSEVFFGDRYKVLRGGSWATHPRVKTLTFRNWDLPIRSQIFAGVRLAREAAA